MELGVIRELFKKYELTHWKRYQLVGYHKRAIKIQQFIMEFAHRDSNYHFTSTELLRLVLLLSSLNDDLTLITNLKKALSHNNSFFETIQILYDNMLLDDEIFTNLHNTRDNETRSIIIVKAIIQFLGYIQMLPTQTSRLVFIKMVLTILDEQNSNEQQLLKIEQVLTRLKKDDLLTGSILVLITTHQKTFSYFHAFIAAIQNDVLLLSYSHVDKFLEHNDSKEIVTLIEKINDNKLPIKSDLITKILSTKHMISLLSQLLNKAFLSDKIINDLLHKDDSFIHEITLLLTLDLLNKSNLTNVIAVSDNYNLCQIIHFLHKKYPDLLDDTIINLLCIHSDLPELLKNLTALSNGLINKDTLTLFCTMRIYDYWKLALINNLPLEAHDKQTILIKLLNTDSKMVHELINIVNLLIKIPENLFQNVLDLISINYQYYPKIYKTIIELEKKELFTSHSYGLLIDKINIKIPAPQPVAVEIELEKSDINANYRFTETNRNFFITAHLGMGGRAHIFQATDPLNSLPPQFIKTIRVKKDGANNEDEFLKEIRRETKYLRFMGREANFFKLDQSLNLASDWQEGLSLDKIKTEVFIKIPFKQRLACLMPLLISLIKLHEQYRVHGDIKPANCVFDDERLALHWIDFGSTRKVKSKRDLIATSPAFCDQNITNLYSFCNDMFSLSYIIASIFPEIYTITSVKFQDLLEVQLINPESKNNLPHRIIYNLISSLRHISPSARCTSKLALAYCQNVLTEYESLNSETLNNIVKHTLQKETFSCEDILYDRCAI